MTRNFRFERASFQMRPEQVMNPARVVFLSVEGSKTEVAYFYYVERYRKELDIDDIVHIEVLKKQDTNSGIQDIVRLLDDYMAIRNNPSFSEEINSLELDNYTSDFINRYIQNPDAVNPKERRKFEGVLKSHHLDLLYLNFLNTYHGKHDVFGVVLDRDAGSHDKTQLEELYRHCEKNGYYCFISNPCIEFWFLLHKVDVAEAYKDQLGAILRNEKSDSKHTYVSDLLYSVTNQRKAIGEKTFRQHYLYNTDKAIERAKKFASGKDVIDSLGTNMVELFGLLREDPSSLH